MFVNMLWEGIDKRSFPRAKYKCMVKITDHGQEEIFDTFTENIGGGGVCVVLGKEIDLFKTANLDLYLSDEKTPITCRGTIVWAIRRRLGNRKDDCEYDTGIEFIDISDNDRARITELVSDILSA